MSVVPVTNPEQWSTNYENASAEQQYELLLQAIAQPLSPDLVEEIDLGMLLIEMRDALVSHNLIDQAIQLIHTLQQRQPRVYAQEFAYLDDIVVKYYLYREEPDHARVALQQFMAAPAEDIDQTLSLLDYLKFYNQPDLAVDFCRTAYEPVAESSNVLPGTELELSDVVVHHRIQQAYEQMQAGQRLDIEAFQADMATFGFDDSPDWIQEISHDLNTDVCASPEFLTEFKRDRARAVRHLLTNFCRVMWEQKQVSFVCSGAIWETVFDFLERRQLPRKQLAQPDSYFTFTAKSLEEWTAQKIGGFLSMQQARGFALLWGLPYIYDWLLSKQLIRDAAYQTAIETVNRLKAQLTKDFPQLWQYDFVHRWQRPDSLSETEFADEVKRFASSLDQVTPLSSEPGTGIGLGVRQNLRQNLALLAERNYPSDEPDKLDDELYADESIERSPEPKTSSPAKLKPIKPQKTRKSPLQLAAELSPPRNKSANSKKKK